MKLEYQHLFVEDMMCVNKSCRCHFDLESWKDEWPDLPLYLTLPFTTLNGASCGTVSYLSDFVITEGT